MELHCDIVPRTCENFLALCAMNYYDGTLFHRSIKHFMIQVSLCSRIPISIAIATNWLNERGVMFAQRCVAATKWCSLGVSRCSWDAGCWGYWVYCHCVRNHVRIHVLLRVVIQLAPAWEASPFTARHSRMRWIRGSHTPEEAF